jgi:hypothetical protein
MSKQSRPYEPLTSENAALILVDHQMGLIAFASFRSRVSNPSVNHPYTTRLIVSLPNVRRWPISTFATPQHHV